MFSVCSFGNERSWSGPYLGRLVAVTWGASGVSALFHLRINQSVLYRPLIEGEYFANSAKLRANSRANSYRHILVRTPHHSIAGKLVCGTLGVDTTASI